jgi:polysaccharide export outer membrane protein
MFEYRVMDDDLLQVAVWQNPELSTDCVVRPDGKISLPLIGDVPTTGKSIPELRREITALLSEYIRHPQVFVTIRKFGGKKYIVLGEVSQPGVFKIDGSTTVLEAIAEAGGFTNHAVASSVILIRGGLDAPNAERLNLTKALDQGDLRQNINLASQDIIFVPKKFIANLNYFLTQILEPLRTSGAVATEAATWYYGGYAPSTVKKMLDNALQSTVVIQ